MSFGGTILRSFCMIVSLCAVTGLCAAGVNANEHVGASAKSSLCPPQFSAPPLHTRKLFVDREVEEDFVQEISAHLGYWRDPFISDFGDGRMDRAARFEFMIDDASPLTPEYDVNSRSPFDYDHVSILAQTTTERPIWVILGAISEKSNEDPDFVTLESGVQVKTPGDILFLGEFLLDFEAVDWASGKIFPYEDSDYFVRRTDQGEIDQILECIKDGRRPNPSCQLTFLQDPLWIQAGFNKSDLGRLSIIRQNTLNFVQCILQ